MRALGAHQFYSDSYGIIHIMKSVLFKHSEIGKHINDKLINNISFPVYLQKNGIHDVKKKFTINEVQIIFYYKYISTDWPVPWEFTITGVDVIRL